MSKKRDFTPKEIRYMNKKIEELSNLKKRDDELIKSGVTMFRRRELRTNIEAYDKEIEFMEYLIKNNK